jgi:beta-galactosidase
VTGGLHGKRLPCACVLLLSGVSGVKSANSDAGPFAPPASPRAIYSFDVGWKFIRQDVPGAEAPGFDDSGWTVVSTPHTYNDVDTFNRIISHSGGQQGAYVGAAWYRKHFSMPSEWKGHKLFLEFEGMRQAGQIFLNGKIAGLSENGVTAYGVDITGGTNFGNSENVLAVRVDNSGRYAERATGTVFEWESKDFNPNYGGINRHVWLHAMGPIHQTLPLYDGLKTSGVYIYPSNTAVADGGCDVNIEAQVANESKDRASVSLSAVVVDGQGHVSARCDGDTVDLAGGKQITIKAVGHLSAALLWSPDEPSLYDVYTIWTVGGNVIDVAKTTTGFRKTEFRGGAGIGGVSINDKFTYLTGYSQRSTNEWAGLGQAYPDWMHDLTARLIRDSHANYLRWMHISPQRVDVCACDRAGIVEVCPAGDKEKDVEGRQWEQRIEVMRDSMIYFRNNPSILFWEAGNNGISADHMQQIVELKRKWDPSGGRVIGCRTLNDPAATPVAEYFGVMIGQDPRIDSLKGPSDMFRAYSAERRDRAPIIETEDFRDEAARRFWDDYSPPDFGFKPGPNDTYHWNSETFCLAAAARYWSYSQNRISNLDPRHSRWSGYASIYFSDSNADGRQDSSEVARVSGKVDAVRLPKEAYYAYRVMQNPRPDLHIVGHWTYPAGTKKTIYVIANHCEAVELSMNGRPLGRADQPTNGYVFAFPDVIWELGTIKATGYDGQGKIVCTDALTTAGPAKRVKLTVTTGPGGVRADGADVALFDVEVCGADGQRCPTDQARIDFTIDGPGVWRGGYNSGKVGSTNNLYVDTECGINRVAIRSTLAPGVSTLTASRPGLASATVHVNSVPIELTGGLLPVTDSR